MKKWSPEFIEQLVAADTPQQFLNVFVKYQPNSNQKQLNFSDLARRSGFASRAYCRELVLGLKPITIKSAQKLVIGLKLTGVWRSYFLTLCGHDQPLSSANESRSEQNARHSSLRNRLQVMYHLSKQNAVEPSVNYSLIVNRIYASLGANDTGALLEEIIERSGLQKDDILSHIDRMTASKIVRFDQTNGRFYPCETHLSTIQVSDKDTFRIAIEDSFIAARRHLRKGLNSEKSLYLASSVSVKSQNLALIKENLRETLLKFIDQIEDPDGDVVLELLTASWPNEKPTRT